MELEELLNLEPSRHNIDQVISIVKKNPSLFDILWKIYLQDKNPVSRRAAWAIDLLNEKGYVLSDDHISELMGILPSLKHDGMKRHSLRILESRPVSEEYIGRLADVCFNWLQEPASAVAVKMYSIKILTNIAEKEPAICRELIDIIEIQLDESTPGFRNIGLKTIKKLQKGISALKS